MGVETRRKKQELRIESLQRRKDLVAEIPQIGLLAGAGRQRNVYRVSLPSANPRLAPRTGPRIERILVKAYEKDRRVVLKNMLRAISVMDIPIKNCHSFPTVVVLSVPDPNRHVVEKAKSHWFSALGMVAGGTDCAERRVGCTGRDSVHCAEDPARREERHFQRTLRSIRITSVKKAAPVIAHAANVVDMLPGVNFGDGFNAGGSGRNRHETGKHSRSPQMIDHRLQPLWALRVVPGRHVLEVQAVIDKRDTMHDCIPFRGILPERRAR